VIYSVHDRAAEALYSIQCHMLLPYIDTINHLCSFRPFSRRLLLLPPLPLQSNQTTLSTPPLPLHIVTSCPDMLVLDKAMLAALPQRLLRTDRNDRKFEQ
jgi:hypothetical protein